MNTSIDNLTMEETLSRIGGAIDTRQQIHHVVVNAAKMVAMQSDLELRKSVNEADLINADGQAVVWASRFLGKPLKERVAGIDLMENLVEYAYLHNYTIYLLGATEAVLECVVKKYRENYSKNLIAGYRDGYFSEEEQHEVAQQISASNADMLFVAISSPKKEHFLFKQKSILTNIPFIMGVGGSFDVVAGKVKRAPKWMQQCGL